MVVVDGDGGMHADAVRMVTVMADVIGALFGGRDFLTRHTDEGSSSTWNSSCLSLPTPRGIEFIGLHTILMFAPQAHCMPFAIAFIEKILVDIEQLVEYYQ